MRKMIRTCSILLMCLTITTTCMVGRLLAKYTTTASGSDSASAAGFYMNIEAIDELPGGLVWNPVDGDGNKNEFQFKVVGSSEVEMSYQMKVKLTHANGTAYMGWDTICPNIIDAENVEHAEGDRIKADDQVSCTVDIKNTFIMNPTEDYEEKYILKLTDNTTTAVSDRFLIEILIDAVQVD